MPRFLRQATSGYIYDYTETLAKRKDMMEISEGLAIKIRNNISMRRPGLINVSLETIGDEAAGNPPDNAPNEVEGLKAHIKELETQLNTALSLLGMPQDKLLDLTDDGEGRVIMDEEEVEAGEPPVDEYDKGAGITIPGSVDAPDEVTDLKPIEVPGVGEATVDPEIAMLEDILKRGKGKAEIEAYMLEKYGIDVDRREKLDTLVDQAIAKRKETIAALEADTKGE